MAKLFTFGLKKQGVETKKNSERDFSSKQITSHNFAFISAPKHMNFKQIFGIFKYLEFKENFGNLFTCICKLINIYLILYLKITLF